MSEAGRDSFGRAVPATGERARILVSRPRVPSLLGFTALTALGVALLPLETAGLLIGLFIGLVGLGGLLVTALTRVWVEGPVLILGGRIRREQTLRLDRLTYGSLTAFGRNRGPTLHLGDRDGNALVIDATNLRLVPLYAVLAQHVPAGGTRVDPRLEKRLARYRRGELPFAED